MARQISIVICLLAVIAAIRAFEVCCPDTGCVNYDPPYDVMPRPSCPDSVTFKLYTRSNPAGELFSVRANPFSYNGLRRTIFISHGLIESSSWSYVSEMKEAFLKKEDCNVIIIDWEQGAKTIYVPQASSNARISGFLAAKVAQNLLRLPNGDPNKFWCAGFSTGAHLCGYLGMAMPSTQRFGRVTGMSPAGPGMEDIPDVRIGINPSSAKFVDIIHSDISHLFGTKRRVGHHDYYFTGHEWAIDLSLTSIFNLQPLCEGLCQHRRSKDFFISSIGQTAECFASNRHCSSEFDIPGSCYSDAACWAYGGYNANRSCVKSGIVHIPINSKAPYCSNL